MADGLPLILLLALTANASPSAHCGPCCGLQAGGPSSPASDMYAIGVVLFRLHYPTANLIPGMLQFPQRQNNSIEPSASADNEDLRNLLQALLHQDPVQRPTAANALLHPYFRRCYVDRLRDDGELVEQKKKLDAFRVLLSGVQQEVVGRWDSPIAIEVDRQSSGGIGVVDTMLDYAMSVPEVELARPLKILFRGEAGVDNGGLLTEMYTLFFESVVAEEVGLFEASGPGGGSPGLPLSVREGDWLYLPKAGQIDEYNQRRLKGFGRLVVKCLFDGRRIGGRFAPSLFKYIKGVKVDLQVSTRVGL